MHKIEEEYSLRNGIDYAEKNLAGGKDSHLHHDFTFIKNNFVLQGKSILDFGCGMGSLAVWLSQNGKVQKVDALDIDPHHLLVAHKLVAQKAIHNIKFYPTLSIVENKYDIITMTDVVEHIQTDELVSILTDLNKCLKKNGSLFISYPPWTGPWAAHIRHILPLPWVQFLIPRNKISTWLRKKNITLVGSKESTMHQAFDHLNQMQPSKLAEYLGQAGFKIVHRHSYCIFNKLPFLQKISFSFLPFLVTKEFLVIHKL